MSDHRRDRFRIVDAPSACPRTRARLIDFQDGTLDFRAHRAVEQHLDVCSSCRREWDWQRRSEEILSAARQSVPDVGDTRADFYARLAHAAPAGSASFTRNSYWRRAGLPIAFALSVAVVAMYTSPNFSRQGIMGAIPGSHPVDPGVAHLSQAPTHKFPDQSNSSLAALSHRVPASYRSHAALVVIRDRMANASHQPSPFATAAASYRIGNPSAPRSVLTANMGVLKNVRRDEPLLNHPEPPASDGDSSGTERDAISIRAAAVATLAGSTEHSTNPSTRAELMNEEVNIRLVNDRNELVNSIDVAPETGSAEQSPVIHVEADASVARQGDTTSTP